jgi:hypothetical protein
MRKLIVSFLIVSLNAYGYPVGLKSQNGSPSFPSMIKVPNSSATLVTGGTLIETGNDNLLVNPNFEGTIGAEWTTGATGTVTATTTSGEFSEGLRAMKITTAGGGGGGINVTQAITTLSGAVTQHVVGVNYKWLSTDITDFQICTTVNGSEKTCVPTANLIGDNVYHSIEIPEVATAGQTLGIKFKTTLTNFVSKSVYLDKAYIRQGIGTQNLALDSVYSFAVNSSNVVTKQNKTWVSTAVWSPAGTLTVTPVAGIFTVAPNCWAISADSGQRFVNISSSATSIVFTNRSNDGTANSTASSANVFCQKSGNDYLASSAAVYSQAMSAGVFMRATGITPVTSANSPIKWPAITNDTTNGAYSVSTGQFTVTQSGYYDVSVYASAVEAIGSYYYISLNGSTSVTATTPQICYLSQTNGACVGTATFYATSGQTIDVRTQNAITGQGNTGDYLTIKKSSANTPIVGSFADMIPKIAYLSDVKSSGTSGGSASATTTHTRTLNTEVDEYSIVSLNANQFTLGAGTYRIQSSTLAYNTSYHRSRIRNITDGTTSLFGTSEYASSVGGGSNRSTTDGEVVLASSKVFELQHYTAGAQATNGLGLPVSSGESEVYSTVTIQKIK